MTIKYYRWMDLAISPRTVNRPVYYNIYGRESAEPPRPLPGKTIKVKRRTQDRVIKHLAGILKHMEFIAGRK